MIRQLSTISLALVLLLATAIPAAARPSPPPMQARIATNGNSYSTYVYIAPFVPAESGTGYWGAMMFSKAGASIAACSDVSDGQGAWNPLGMQASNAQVDREWGDARPATGEYACVKACVLVPYCPISCRPTDSWFIEYCVTNYALVGKSRAWDKLR